MSQLKDLFVPYELAVMAKEKGFDELCICWYTGAKNLVDSKYNREGGYLNNSHFAIKKVELNRCTAPLYQQIQNWLFDKHGIFISMYDYNHVDTPKAGIRFSIAIYGFTEIGMSENGDFKSIPEALTKAIEKAFTLIP